MELLLLNGFRLLLLLLVCDLLFVWSADNSGNAVETWQGSAG
jgi:hypothetical protein